jgi:hypothetical protein
MIILSEFEGMSLYWDRRIPQCSIFSAGTAIRLDMKTEPSFCIFVAASSPSNPDLHVGDVILRIDDMQVPSSFRGGQSEQQHVFQKCALLPASFFRFSLLSFQVFRRTCIISSAGHRCDPARATFSSRY